MKRYLIYFAYVGKAYSGLQVQNQPGVRSVAGAILHAARSLDLEDVSFKSSSRTDKGVHALCNSATLDILEGILHTRRVPLTFSPRKCLSRSYVYRFCFAKHPEQMWSMPFPPQEYQKIWLARDTLDIDAMMKGAELMCGTHDFSYFTTNRFEKEKEWRNPVKEMDIQIEGGRGYLDDHMPHFTHNFSSWNAVFTSGSFLYRQIRLMMSTLCDIGRKETSLEQLEQMLENPQKFKDENPDKVARRVTAPAYALHLRNIIYDETDMELTEEEKQNEDVETPLWLVNTNAKNMNLLGNRS